MKRRLLVAIPLLTLVALLAWVLRPRRESLGEAYVSDRSVMLWSSAAQVRESRGMLHYGERVELLSRRNGNLRVRTTGGAVGWVDGRLLMEPSLWQRSAQLLAKTRDMPVQARGRTKVATNLHVEPGRKQARLYQFGRGISVEIVGRGVADWVQGTDEKEPSGEAQEAKKEDWFLIRALAGGARTDTSGGNNECPGASEVSDQPVPVAGWVVARFIELDLPGALREATASANVRPLAWFELNRVPDSSGDKPQYLVAGVRGAEGQRCDFTTLRVLTWNHKRTRYETAFIENNLCGRLPIALEKGPSGEPEFRFRSETNEERVYHLKQTVVRRVHESGEKNKPAPRTAKPS